MECWITIIKENNVASEAGNLMDYLYSEEWIRTVEHGTKREFIDALGAMIDPLAYELMGAYGPDVVGAMPTEMHQWIKDTTILWIKNKGAGNAITEGDILNDASTIRNRNDIKEVKAYYEAKILKMTQQIVDLTQENQQYKQAIRQMETKAERQLTTINELKQDSEDAQQQIINLYSKISE